MRTVLTIAVFCLSVPIAAAQERSTEGIVLIRLVGRLTAVLQDDSRRQIEETDVQVGTGTGTIVSRFGHIVTNEHVVTGGQFKAPIRGVPAIVTVTVERVEACFPPSQRSDRPSGCVDASVVATDPDLDLALLTISGNDFSYVPFGDSDVVKAGEPASAVGYPLGEKLDIAREPGTERLAPTVSAGVVSAIREDQQRNVRYIQTSAPVNPGDSGGPLLDRGGFATGIIEMRVRSADAIGFAIPINLVKEFLARNGADTFMPSARLTLGYVFDSPEKLIRLQAPSGFEDSARSRLQVDSGTSVPGVALRIDRVASPWSLEQLENELLQGHGFERAPSTRAQSSSHEDRILRGEAYSHAGGGSVRSLYAIVDLGEEKVVARYVGSAEQVAFSESLLAASLASIEVAPMIVAAAREPRDAAWTRIDSPGSIPVVPPGWVVDAGAPMPCVDLPAPGEPLVASPRRDFTVSFRVGRYPSGLDATQAAARCAGRRGSATKGDYRYTLSRFGVEYTIEGRFETSPSGVTQLEVVAPARKFAAARELFSRWNAELAPRPGSP